MGDGRSGNMTVATGDARVSVDQHRQHCVWRKQFQITLARGLAHAFAKRRIRRETLHRVGKCGAVAGRNENSRIGVNRSGEPPTFVVMIGNPCAIASITLFDVPSANDGNTNTSSVRMNALHPTAPSYEPTNSHDPLSRNSRTRAFTSCTAGPVPAKRTSTSSRLCRNCARASASTNGPLPVSIRAANPKIVSFFTVQACAGILSMFGVVSDQRQHRDRRQKRKTLRPLPRECRRERRNLRTERQNFFESFVVWIEWRQVMRRSHLVIQNGNTRFFAGANHECGARVRREHVQQIVMMIERSKRGSFCSEHARSDRSAPARFCVSLFQCAERTGRTRKSSTADRADCAGS